MRCIRSRCRTGRKAEGERPQGLWRRQRTQGEREKDRPLEEFFRRELTTTEKVRLVDQHGKERGLNRCPRAIGLPRSTYYHRKRRPDGKGSGLEETTDGTPSDRHAPPTCARLDNPRYSTTFRDTPSYATCRGAVRRSELPLVHRC